MNLKPIRLPIALTAFVASVLCLGSAALAWSWIGGQDGTETVPLMTLAFWFVFSMASETFWLPTASGKGMVSMSLAANLALLFVLPLHLALTVIATSVTLADILLHRRNALRSLFNAAQSTLCLFVASVMMHLLGSPIQPAGSSTFLLAPAATLIVPIVFCLLNTLAVSGAIYLETRDPFWATWKRNYGFGYHYLNCAILFALGLGLVVAVETVGYIGGLVSILFLVTSRDLYRLHIRKRTASPS